MNNRKLQAMIRCSAVHTARIIAQSGFFLSSHKFNDHTLPRKQYVFALLSYNEET